MYIFLWVFYTWKASQKSYVLEYLSQNFHVYQIFCQILYMFDPLWVFHKKDGLYLYDIPGGIYIVIIYIFFVYSSPSQASLYIKYLFQVFYGWKIFLKAPLSFSKDNHNMNYFSPVLCQFHFFPTYTHIKTTTILFPPGFHPFIPLVQSLYLLSMLLQKYCHRRQRCHSYI